MPQIIRIAVYILLVIFAAAFAYWVLDKLVIAAGAVPVFLVVAAQIVIVGVAVVAIIWKVLPLTK